jgi:hypothetical protein
MYNVYYLTTEIYDTYLISSSWFFFNSVVRVFFSSSANFWRLLENKILLKKKDEDIKDVIRSHESKKETIQWLQYREQKDKHWSTKQYTEN